MRVTYYVSLDKETQTECEAEVHDGRIVIPAPPADLLPPLRLRRLAQLYEVLGPTPPRTVAEELEMESNYQKQLSSMVEGI
jgi:hypothetical protein